MKKLLIPFLVILFGAGISSCSKNNITFECPHGSNGSGSDSTSANNKIDFYASVDALTPSRALTSFPIGRYASIYVYDSGTQVTTPQRLLTNYVSESLGVLSPEAEPMLLPNGTYDLYSVATTSTTNITPTFANGVSTALTNNVDYIWWSKKGLIVQSASESVNIAYSHSCAQIVLKMTAGDGVTITAVDSVSITPPATTGTMNLGTGVITPATTLAAEKIAMGVNQNVSQAIVLPITASLSLDTDLYIRIDGEVTPRTYNVSIPIPDGALKAGNSYLFEAVVNANDITFPKVSIISWVTVDETGTPLYPSEV